MIRRYQEGREPVEMVLIGAQLVGPPATPLIPYHYTCTNPLEQGLLRARGITARLELPPGVKAPWQIEREAKR